MDQCRELAPECEPSERLESLLVSRSSPLKSYDRAQCCRDHPWLREGVGVIFKVLGNAGLALSLESGSALGHERHNGTQIPWETDGDIAVLVEPSTFPDISPEAAFSGIGSEADAACASFERVIALAFAATREVWAQHWGLKYLCKETGQAQIRLVHACSKGGDVGVDIWGLITNPSNGVMRYVGSAGLLRGALTLARASTPPDLRLEDMFPGRPCNFYDDAIVLCPRNVNAYLTKYYGPDWPFAGRYKADAMFHVRAQWALAVCGALCARINGGAQFVEDSFRAWGIPYGVVVFPALCTALLAACCVSGVSCRRACPGLRNKRRQL